MRLPHQVESVLKFGGPTKSNLRESRLLPNLYRYRLRDLIGNREHEYVSSAFVAWPTVPSDYRSVGFVLFSIVQTPLADRQQCVTRP